MSGFYVSTSNVMSLFTIVQLNSFANWFLRVEHTSNLQRVGWIPLQLFRRVPAGCWAKDNIE